MNILRGAMYFLNSYYGLMANKIFNQLKHLSRCSVEKVLKKAAG